jgi:hypothetical protein
VTEPNTRRNNDSDAFFARDRAAVTARLTAEIGRPLSNLRLANELPWYSIGYGFRYLSAARFQNVPQTKEIAA